jgi:ProP effector
MGFEQLAVLKQQFEKEKQAKRAQSKPAGKPAHKPASKDASKPASNPASKPASAPVSSKPAAKPPRPPSRPPRPAARPAAPVAVRSKPVDPVVLTIGKLQKRFPKAFPKNPSPKVPLKIGIFEDLLAHATEMALTETELRAAIKIWCRGSRYWTAMVEGAIRVDLSGEEAGRVSPEDGVRATKLEEGRLARVASKAATPEKAAGPENAAAPENATVSESAAAADNETAPEKAAVSDNVALPENAAAPENTAVPDSEKVAD